MKSASMEAVFRRLGEAKTRFLDERAHEPMEMREPPLFLRQEEYDSGSKES